MTGDTTSLGTYAVHMIGGLAVAALFIVALGVAWHRHVERRLRQHVGRALNNGDAHILRAVQEREHVRRQTVPKTLTGRNPR